MTFTSTSQYALFLIDCQNDFCNPKGTLFVKGAVEDCNRISTFIKNTKNRIVSINATLDTHRQHDIAHPYLWVNSQGANPNPFTIITKDDVSKNVWMPTHNLSASDRKKMSEYVENLDNNGRYPLCIWPPHCLVGSWGMNVEDSVMASFLEWERVSGRPVNYVNKGYNIFTEHYSAIQADVPDPTDPSTQTNLNLIRMIDAVSARPNTTLLIGGEALSHCVANTVTDLLANMSLAGKNVAIVKDWCSNVPGFEAMGTNFLAGLPAEVAVIESKDLV